LGLGLRAHATVSPPLAGPGLGGGVGADQADGGAAGDGPFGGHRRPRHARLGPPQHAGLRVRRPNPRPAAGPELPHPRSPVIGPHRTRGTVACLQQSHPTVARPSCPFSPLRCIVTRSTQLLLVTPPPTLSLSRSSIPRTTGVGPSTVTGRTFFRLRLHLNGFPPCVFWSTSRLDFKSVCNAGRKPMLPTAKRPFLRDFPPLAALNDDVM